MAQKYNIAPTEEVNEEGQEAGLSSLGTNDEITSRGSEGKPRGEAKQRRFELRKKARSALHDTRLIECGRKPVPRALCVEVRKGKDHVFFTNLRKCGSVWVCPVCSMKISLNHVKEVGQAIEKQKARGGDVLMVTQTVKHNASQTLEEVLSKVMSARERQGRQRSFRRLMERTGVEGTIRALEITYGANGWHVHIHELYFIAPGRVVYRIRLQEELLKEWQGACKKAGLEEPNKRGINVDSGTDKAKYMNKWGLECEVVLADQKKGRGHNMTPWELLEKGLYHVFREYALAVKGKKRVVWSRGLRELLELPRQKTNKEAAGEEDLISLVLAVLDLYDWNSIVRQNKEEELRRIAMEEGSGGIRRFLSELSVCTDELKYPMTIGDCAF
jgi:hypothetical protein